MNKLLRKLSGSVLVALLTLLILVGCTNEKKTEEAKRKADDIAVTFVLKEAGKQFDEKEVVAQKDESLLQALKENFKVDEQDGFITSIAGKSQDEKAQKYWTFTINDKFSEVGAKDVKLKDQDQVVFELAEMK